METSFTPTSLTASAYQPSESALAARSFRAAERVADAAGRARAFDAHMRRFPPTLFARA